MFFIIEQAKEAVLDFSKGTVEVYDFKIRNSRNIK